MPLFDLRALFQAVDAERQHQGLSWDALARQVRVAASTIRRYGNGDDAEADGVLAVLRWLGAEPERYITGDAPKGQPLPTHGPGYIRVDMELIAAASGDPKGANGRTRTTIQNLVEVAHRSHKPVASLTRLSEA